MKKGEIFDEIVIDANMIIDATTQLMMLEMVLKFWYTETSLSDEANTQATNGLSIIS